MCSELAATSDTVDIDAVDTDAVDTDAVVPPNLEVSNSVAAHFAELPDPRINRRKRHLLADILTIALCAVLCGADDFVEI